MFEKILVPLDRTRTSELSLPVARNISEAYDSQIILLTVNEVAQFHGQIHQDIIACWESYCRQALLMEDEGIRKYMETVFQNILLSSKKATWVTALGKASEQIVYFADSYDVDLIIITTHGYFRSNVYPFNSVATEVLRDTRKPLLILDNNYNHSNILHKTYMEEICEYGIVGKSLSSM